jgi:hypothetical protein
MRSDVAEDRHCMPGSAHIAPERVYSRRAYMGMECTSDMEVSASATAMTMTVLVQFSLHMARCGWL